MKLTLLVSASVLLVLAGCSKPDEEGTSTATPAEKLNRPLPEETAGGRPSAGQNAGTLPGKP